MTTVAWESTDEESSIISNQGYWELKGWLGDPEESSRIGVSGGVPNRTT